MSKRRHPARLRPEAVGQPGAGSPAQRQGDGLPYLAGQRAVAAAPHGEAFDLIGEYPAHAAGQGAEEPPHPQLDHGLPARDRRVEQPPLVAAVDPPRQS
ncbi:hypothetical protein [Dactylosporangium sp. CA-233914]|uniref:hypothetical protein n=1 Tax=Dactylosporangium sp. CA-233914 TaxID=3239934 RepID=UPI003D8C5337